MEGGEGKLGYFYFLLIPRYVPHIPIYLHVYLTNPPVKKLSAYDEDAALAVSALLHLKTCNGRIGATGMCLGGHLAYRAALDARVAAAVCYFATDLHGRSLGLGMRDDSLERAGEVGGELIMVRWFSCLVSSWLRSAWLFRRFGGKGEGRRGGLMTFRRSSARGTITFPPRGGT